VVDALFPVKCVVCGRFFDAPDTAQRHNPSRGIGAVHQFNHSLPQIVKQLFNAYLCRGCVNDVVAVAAPICVTCGFMFKSRQGENRICEDCISSPKRFRVARAPVVYDRALMSLIHSFKYRGKIQLANPLGGLLYHAFQRWWDADGIDMVIPVPLYGSRFKRRGYNQAFLLIEHWRKMAAELTMDIAGLRFDNNILARNRSTAPQTGLGRDERRTHMKNAFHVRQADSIRGMRILLVDDVYTTGATVNECARELLNNGARFVDVLTVARAI
jgi:ComF family protein